MKRFFLERLDDWLKEPNRKPLVLNGARQVGKTWLLKEFGRTRFDSVAYVNFDKNASAKALFGGEFRRKDMLSDLETFCGTRIVPGRTLVFFDEIQLCPDAIRSLKYWQEEAPDHVVVSAGSLIGLALLEGTGWPVGKTRSMTLRPLSFREFLCAVGEEPLSDLVAEGDARRFDAFSERLVRRLKEYLCVGGMPAAVAAFAETGSHAAARAQQRDILSDYARDFGKHAPKALVPRIRALWKSLPLQLAKEDKRFVSAEVPVPGGGKSRARDLRDAFEWLEAAGVAHRVWNVSKPDVPLDAYRNHVFKLFGVDVGLLAAQSGLAARTILDGSRVFTEFKGALTEQFVQQELRAAADAEPFYWTTPDSRTEVDFLVELSGLVVPVEAKAACNLRAKSLKSYRERFAPPLSVRTSLAGLRREADGLVNLPLFAVSRLPALAAETAEAAGLDSHAENTEP